MGQAEGNQGIRKEEKGGLRWDGIEMSRRDTATGRLIWNDCLLLMAIETYFRRIQKLLLSTIHTRITLVLLVHILLGEERFNCIIHNLTRYTFSSLLGLTSSLMV